MKVHIEINRKWSGILDLKPEDFGEDFVEDLGQDEWDEDYIHDVIQSDIEEFLKRAENGDFPYEGIPSGKEFDLNEETLKVESAK